MVVPEPARRTKSARTLPAVARNAAAALETM
jgi:hypothetical protein